MRYNPQIAAMKGIAIIAVVLGHCAAFRFTDLFVNQWHLAVFVFVGGYLFNTSKALKDPCGEILKKIKRLLIPFLIACMAFMLLHNFFYELRILGDRLTFEAFLHGLKRLALLTTDEPMLGAMWFCPAMFFISLMEIVLYNCICRIRHGTVSKKGFVFVLFLPFIVSSLSLYIFHLPSPYCIWHYGVMSFFLRWEQLPDVTTNGN